MSLLETPAETIITINAGGTIFQTYQETLTRGSAYFQAYFGGKFHKPDPRKPIFLDMDSECFRCLLLRMRIPGYDLTGNPAATNIPEIRSAAAFLGMELPPTPEEKKRLEEEAKVALLAPSKQDLYELAVRLDRGDCVEVLYPKDIWRTDTFCEYNPTGNFPWDFQGIRKKMLWWEDQPQIRVTDPAERAKILARADPDLTRVVFSAPQ